MTAFMATFSRAAVIASVLWTTANSLAGEGEPVLSPSKTVVPNMVFVDSTIDDVATGISAQTGVKVATHGEAGKARVTVVGKDFELEALLTRLCDGQSLVWFRNEQDGSYGISDEKWYKANILPGSHPRAKVLRPDHLTPSEAEAIIRSMLTPNLGAVTAFPKSGKVVFSDAPEKMEEIEAAIAAADAEAGRKHPDGPGRGSVRSASPVIGGQAIMSGARASLVFAFASRKSGVRIRTYGTVGESNISYSGIDVPVEEFLERLATEHGWVWFREGRGDYGISDSGWFRSHPDREPPPQEYHGTKAPAPRENHNFVALPTASSRLPVREIPVATAS